MATNSSGLGSSSADLSSSHVILDCAKLWIKINQHSQAFWCFGTTDSTQDLAHAKWVLSHLATHHNCRRTLIYLHQLFSTNILKSFHFAIIALFFSSGSFFCNVKSLKYLWSHVCSYLWCPSRLTVVFFCSKLNVFPQPIWGSLSGSWWVP